MKAVLIFLAAILALGLIGGGSQGNLPFQNGHGWQGNPSVYGQP